MITFPAHPDCTACKLHTGACSVGVPTRLARPGTPGGPALLCVGQNPGQTEDQRNECFIGRSGHELDKWLDPIARRLPDLSIYYSNAIRCGPDSVTDARFVDACFPLHTLPDIDRILAAHSRLTILALGAPAVRGVSSFLAGEALSLTDFCRRQPFTIERALQCPLCDGTAHAPGPYLCIHCNGRGSVVHTLQLLATYHPAAKMRDRGLTDTIADHIALLYDVLSGPGPAPLYPTFVPPRSPRTADPIAAALDTETYGLFAAANGRALPEQTEFNPALCMARDGIERHELVHTVALTLVPSWPPNTTPSPSCSPSDSPLWSALAAATPGDTMVFRLPHDRALLAAWARHLRVLFGMNLPFDINMLDAIGLHFDPALTLDVASFNVLENERRPERGLKDVARILGLCPTWRPPCRFGSPDHPDVPLYQGRDTHISILVLAALARRLLSSYQPSPTS